MSGHACCEHRRCSVTDDHAHQYPCDTCRLDALLTARAAGVGEPE